MAASSLLGFIERINLANIYFNENVNLSEFTYMKTGGIAKLIIFPSSKEQLSVALKTAAEFAIKFKIIGNTSNLLFLDDTEYQLLISTVKLNKVCIDSQSKIITAETGIMVPDLARFALSCSLSGMEGLEGIPGTLGGAVFMNAGAYGSEVRDCLISIETVDSSGNFRNYTAEQAGLTHRSSIFRKSDKSVFVYACRFRLYAKDERAIYSKMELFHAKRHRYQDFMYPNLGSIFSGSPYRAMAKKNKIYGFVVRLYMFLAYKIKIIGRESPINRRWINDYTVKCFNLKYEKQPFSDKTINCLVNRGQGSAEMVRFIKELETLIDERAPLENEIVEGF